MQIVHDTSGCSSQGFSWSPSNRYLSRSKLASKLGFKVPVDRHDLDRANAVLEVMAQKDYILKHGTVALLNHTTHFRIFNDHVRNSPDGTDGFARRWTLDTGYLIGVDSVSIPQKSTLYILS